MLVYLLYTGILVVKKSLFKNPVPSVCGGGTVFFVSYIPCAFPPYDAFNVLETAPLLGPCILSWDEYVGTMDRCPCYQTVCVFLI